MSDSETYVPSSPADDEQLVAYLDGELDETQSAEVERRLLSDIAYRGRMQELQATWDLLDRLPDAHTGDSFTKTTIELVARQAAKDLTLRRHGRWAKPVRAGLFVLAGFACATLGFSIIRYSQGEPTRALIRDLRVIENMDVYSDLKIDRNIDYVDFLKQLDQAKLFSTEEANDE